MQKVVVIGQGYVGLPVAMRAVEQGFDVVGIDLDGARVQRLRDSDSYVDDVPDALLRSAYSTGRYLASTDYSAARDFDVAVITVPTPLSETLPDLSFIESAASALAEHLKRGATVVLESTTYPGTTEELLVPILEQGSGLRVGEHFAVGYSPERIDPGNKQFGFVNTPKVVSGVNVASLERVQAFYDALVDRTVPVSGTREAELTKLLENTFRHVNIALVNELAVFAHQLGVNIWESIDAASTKPFGYMRFTPGPGVGGHCLPVDPSYLSWQVRRELGKSFRFVELANDVNDHMPDYVVQRLSAMLNRVRKPLNGSRVLLIGLAYKRNSGDIRESPSLRLIELLLAAGAQLSAIDSWVDQTQWPSEVVRLDAAPPHSDVDVAVIVTDHDDAPFDALGASAIPVFDARNCVPDAAERL